jgi:hypothetical protein
LFVASLNVVSLLARAFGALNPRAEQCALITTVASGKENEKVRRRGDREVGGSQCDEVGVVVRNTARSGLTVTCMPKFNGDEFQL